MIVFQSDAAFEHRQVPSLMECPNDSAKMNVFAGTNCLICPVCKELRWLV